MSLDQGPDLRAAITELGMEGGRVLAQQRPCIVAPCCSVGESHRRAELANAAHLSMRGIPEVLPRQQVRVVENLAEVLNRRAWHPGFAENGQPVSSRLGARHRLDGGGKDLAIAMTQAGVDIALVIEQALEAQPLAQSLPREPGRGADRQPAIRRAKRLVRCGA